MVDCRNLGVASNVALIEEQVPSGAADQLLKAASGIAGNGDVGVPHGAGVRILTVSGCDIGCFR